MSGRRRLVAHAHRCVQLAVGLATFGCGTPEGEDLGMELRSLQPIVGGESAEVGAWPNVVSLEGVCTGTLIAEDLVVYAGHCGEEFENVWLADRVEIDVSEASITIEPVPSQQRHAVDYCRTHPDLMVAGGADLAVCLLTDPIPQVPLVPVIGTCERPLAGEEATLVGYGFESADGTDPGEKRVVRAPIQEGAGQLVIGTDSVGTCAGDSGGPAFVEVADGAEADGRSWRLLGVLSSGTSGACGAGKYVDLSLHTDWIEATSQRDVTPCVDEHGSWAPSPACTLPALNQHGLVDEDALVRRYSGTCGTPFSEGSQDRTGPVTDFTWVDFERDDAEFQWQVIVRADDSDGTGVRRIRAEWYAGESLMAARADEVPPYEFIGVSTTRMATSLRVVATDHAGNESVVTRDLRNDGKSGCSTRSPQGSVSGFGVAAFLLLGWAWRRSPRHMQASPASPVACKIPHT